ncbi:MAG: hypothetical protein ACTSQH_09125, partial [Candidatus Hodarchaeales archaeon]
IEPEFDGAIFLLFFNYWNIFRNFENLQDYHDYENQSSNSLELRDLHIYVSKTITWPSIMYHLDIIQTYQLKYLDVDAK